MSKIPYSFTPIPNYFWEHGWFAEPNCLIFVSWAFSKCSSTSRKVYFEHKEVFLEPFEFICTHVSCFDETGLTRQEMRTQALNLVEAKMLEKSTSKTTSKFTVYKWLTSRFSENSNQQNNHQSTSSQPAVNQQSLYIQEVRSKNKEYQTPPPASSKNGGGGGDILKKSFKFIELCKNKNLDIEERLLNEMYRKYPQAAINIATKLYLRIQKKDKLPPNLGGWFRSEVLKEHDYLEEKKMMEME